jgi:hypothetical protein
MTRFNFPGQEKNWTYMAGGEVVIYIHSNFIWTIFLKMLLRSWSSAFEITSNDLLDAVHFLILFFEFILMLFVCFFLFLNQRQVEISFH